MQTIAPALDDYVAQPYSLSRAAYSMPMRYRKLLHAVMMHAQVSNGIGAEMEFRVSDLVRVFAKGDDSSKAYTQFRLDKFSDELMKLILKIENDNGDWDKYTWVDHCHYSKEKDSLTVVISPKLLPLVLDYRKRYTVVTLEEITKFQGRHAWRYYEMFCTERFRAGKCGNPKNQYFVDLSIDDIRTRLMIGTEEYKATNDLRKKAVDAPVQEINSLELGLYIKAIPQRQGKRLTGFRFLCTVYGPGIGPKPTTGVTSTLSEIDALIAANQQRYDEILAELMSRKEEQDERQVRLGVAGYQLQLDAFEILKAELKEHTD